VAAVNAGEAHGNPVATRSVDLLRSGISGANRLLVIQIPCYNEADTLPLALAELPREMSGFGSVEWIVVDDGSTDETVAVAEKLGVDQVVRLPRNQGLARAFMAGIEAALARGADVIVNTDADNQYCAADIPRLITPILEGRAQIVVGERPIAELGHFSPLKKLLQRLGSALVRWLSGTDVRDAPSGFRAFSRDAAMQLHVFNEYTYTLETIIQAGRKGMSVASVPIRTNGPTRPSRLIQSMLGYLRRQIVTMVRIFMTYRPFHFFSVPGFVSFLLGLLISVRFLYFYFNGDGSGHLQSLILSALLMAAGMFLVIIGLVADLISVNRKLLEDVDGRLKRIESSVSDRGRPDVTV
jgi:glycosyltransferase involved in cell wall biosynthesis